MDVIEKQLAYLNETMKSTAAEANSFLFKYHFGGMVAVLALLNVDLVLLDSLTIDDGRDVVLLVVAVVLILALSARYFSYVLNHYRRFAQSHRKLKYKFELTLHLALCQGELKDYQFFMEQDVDAAPDRDDPPIGEPPAEGYDFREFAGYLLDHHRSAYARIERKDRTYLNIAMIVIVLTLAIRGLFLFMER